MTPLERNEETLKLLHAKYQKLNTIPESERGIEQIDALLELGEKIDALEAKLVKLRKKASGTQEDGEEAARHANATMASFVTDNAIYYTERSDLWWYREHGEWHDVKPRAFREKFRMWLPDADTLAVFYDIIDAQQRKLNAAHYSWKERDGYLNLLSMDSFCPATHANRYHPAFDLMFTSLGGGKEENIEHLERLFLSKWQHPENYLLPCLVFADAGGTGKSLLVTKFLATVFGVIHVADNLSMEMAFGKFNRSIAGKAVAFVNEAPEDREDDKGILRVVHSPMINIEAKGRDPIPACNTALYILATNPKGGYAIRLAHSDVDRRFSIIHGGKPLKWWVAEHYGLPHDNDDEAGDDMMVEELQHVLSDPTEVGRWLWCKEAEYGDVRNVRALHGTDYRKQAGDTLDMHTRVFDAIFQAENFEYIRSDVLFRLYQSNGGTFKNIGFNRLARVYLDDHPHLNITYETQHPWNGRVSGILVNESTPKRTQAQVFVKNAPARIGSDGKRAQLPDNDLKFGAQDQGGRWSFHVDVI